MAGKKKTDEVVAETNVNVEPEQPEVQEKSEAPEPVDTTEEPKGPNLWQKFRTFYTSKKKITIPATVVLGIVLLLVIPLTRYPILGLFIKKDITVTLVDSRSGIELTSLVTLDGKQAFDYPRTFHNVPVGKHRLKTDTGYYKEFDKDIMVNLGRAKKQEIKIPLEATGYTLSFIMHNKITGKAVEGLHIKSGSSETITDGTGRGSVVVDPNLKEAEITVSGEGYNTLTLKKAVTNDPITTFEDTNITPAGKVYFLSKRSGKIDLVKTDLDGANRQTVLAGTGNEEDGNTVLLASRDWKYLALLSRRDPSKPKLYLIETSNDKLTEIDSGDASFSISGWQDHFFVYKVNRNNLPTWQGKHYALKTYNADTKTLATIDETTAEGTSDYDYVSNYIENIYLVKDKIIYTKVWSGSYYSSYRLSGKRNGFYSAKLNNSSKQALHEFDAPAYTNINAISPKPEEIYYAVYKPDNNTSYFEYEDGKLKEVKDTKETSEWFSKPYPTYLLSPGGQSTLWYEERDGKNTLFVGSNHGENGKQIASLSEYIPYGWYSDGYLLVSKKGSELYILPPQENVTDKQVLKISDYHKPAATFYGYGGGYGGL